MHDPPSADDRRLTDDERRQVNELLSEWLVRTRVALSAYNSATTRTLASERRLGIPAVVLSTAVATSVFATLAESPAVGWRIATGTIALLAAVLTALQTFLRQEERAEQYRDAARSYGRLRRRVERTLLFPPETVTAANHVLDELADALAEAGRGKPNLPQRIWDQAEYKIKRRSDARGLAALRLRLRERFHFGVAGSPLSPLAEDHSRYFSSIDDAIIVSLARIRPTTPATAQPAAVATARKRMQEAAQGKRERRAPLEVHAGDDGGFTLIDGNATFAVAEQDGWTTIPVRVVSPSEGATRGSCPAGAVVASRDDGERDSSRQPS